MATNNSKQLFAGDLKCHRCVQCNGYGCPGMMPGLGGAMEGFNFQANYEAWKELYKNINKDSQIEITPQVLRCGPVTGSVENIGFAREEDFYYPYLKNAFDNGLGLCIGDGCPDEKLKLGVKAMQRICEEAGRAVKGAFFLKPYPQNKLYERIDWVKPYAEYIGIDIDSYNILTMRNLVNLERKTASQLEDFRKKTGLPFVIKGVFTEEDVELVKEVHPEVVYISNHGGRVETRKGSTGHFLQQYGTELKKYCQQLWVDGGIRCKEDVETAISLGADQIIVARPLIRGTFDGNYAEELKNYLT